VVTAFWFLFIKKQPVANTTTITTEENKANIGYSYQRFSEMRQHT